MTTEPPWLDWAKRLQAIAQTGLTYAKDPFDVERYTAVREIAARILADRSGQDGAQVLAQLTREEGYATPKVDVRGVVFRNGQILLVKERAEGRWTLPGGWADVCESPRESAEREVEEETGFSVRATRLLAVLDRSKHPHEPLFPFHVYKLFFLCEITGGEAATSYETDEVGFFDEEDLPPLSLTRVLPAQIRRMFAHARNPDWPTDFD